MKMADLRVGHGYDVHRLVEARPLILGGVTIPHDRGLLGHSDADVLLHAICDALLGAAGLGDIGLHFPDTDPAYRGISSLKLLSRTCQLLEEAGFKVHNIDSTLIAQAPKLRPFMDGMRANIASACCLEPDRVNLKATTTEGLGPFGRGEGMAAHAVCLIKKGG
jgi:2-C-methyl-D-erythritol 2,4-cyclodiphosphate synthase